MTQKLLAATSDKRWPDADIGNTAKSRQIRTGRVGIPAMVEEALQLGDSRLQLGEPIKEMALHPVPNKTASWWYVFAVASVLLMLQIVTGICSPWSKASKGHAWESS
jgi:hypothetical protein